MMTFEIPVDHTGPVRSGQGGIAAGMMAQFVDVPAEVRLHAPPPLATPLQVHRGQEGKVHATNDGTTILSGQPAEVDVTVPSVELASARQPADAPGGHLAPDCIVCDDRHPRSLPVQPRPVGTMAASIRGPVPVGQPTVVVAWPLDSPGRRRHRAAVALLGVDGTLHAVAQQTCVAVPADFALAGRGGEP